MRWLGLLLAAAACVNLGIGVVLALRIPRGRPISGHVRMVPRVGIWRPAALHRGRRHRLPAQCNRAALADRLLPTAWVVPIWTLFSLALAPLLPYLVLRCATSGTRRAIVIPILLFLCWTSARTLLQFSVLSMTLAALSLSLADSHPVGSGVSLGLALAKPHIAGPIALWMIATRRIRVLLVSIAVVAVGWGIHDARIGESPLTTLSGYGGILRAIYSGPDGLAGRTSIRSWTIALLPDARAADAAWLSVSLLFVLGVWASARRSPRRPLHTGGMAMPGLFCLCSLLAIYHNINNLVLMLPAFAFLGAALPRRADGNCLAPGGRSR